jgi:type II secretion system protein N
MIHRKKNVLGFTLYGIVITGVFLYLLFPSEIIQSRLEDALQSSHLTLKSESLKPSLPLGFKFRNISVGSASWGASPFQADWLDLQFNPLSFFQKNKSIGLSGKAYGGKFKGKLGFASFSKPDPLHEANVSLQNININRFALLKTLMGKDVSGLAQGTLNVADAAKGVSSATGSVNLVFTKGFYSLAEPFLGMSRIDFDTVEIKARLRDGGFKLEKFTVSGPQIRCTFKGDIALAALFKDSRLNLTGELEILGQNKARMNVTIVGTLANPEMRYI